MKDNFLYLSQTTITVKKFNEQVAAFEKLFKTHVTLLVKSQNLLTLYASIIAAENLKISLYVCPATFSDRQIEELAIQLKGSYYIEEKGLLTSVVEKANETPSIGIFTSGTTGEPKLALHSFEAIESSSQFVPKELYHQTWMLTYAPWSYAGLQVFFSALKSQGSIYYPAEAFKNICHDMIKYNVKIVSATPTFWKMLISGFDLKIERPQLLQATIGAEAVDSSIIHLIDDFFHPKNLTHIYASTEAGVAIVVSDRLAGFPVSALQTPRKNGVKLRISNGELQISTPVGMKTYAEGTNPVADGWIKTGDLVEIRGERVYFLGRADKRINIGGAKVSPEEVEQALNSLEFVEDSLVYEKKSPIVGQLIAADVVLKGSYPFDKQEIREKLKGLLDEYKIPHLIQKVDHLKLTSTGKKMRH